MCANRWCKTGPIPHNLVLSLPPLLLDLICQEMHCPLNHLRTAISKCNLLMSRWGFRNSTACPCRAEEQTIDLIINQYIQTPTAKRSARNRIAGLTDSILVDVRFTFYINQHRHPQVLVIQQCHFAANHIFCSFRDLAM